MTREEYLKKLENIKSFKSVSEQIHAHERLLCEYVQSLEQQIKSLQPHPIEMVSMNVGDLVVIKHGSCKSLHYVTFYGRDEKINRFWGYDGNITKLDGTYCYLKENGVSMGDPSIFATKVYHKYDIRFKVSSDR